MDTWPIIDPVATGANITNMRVAAGMSVRDVQETFGFGTPQTVYKWQKGTTLPNLDNLIVLARLFHVTVDAIIVVKT